jgi:hypothetical protein
MARVNEIESNKKNTSFIWVNAILIKKKKDPVVLAITRSVWYKKKRTLGFSLCVLYKNKNLS